MGYSNGLIKALLKSGADNHNLEDKAVRSKLLKSIAKETNVPISKLRYYNDRNILPSGSDLELICTSLKVTKQFIQLKMGVLDHSLLAEIQENAENILNFFESKQSLSKDATQFNEVFQTSLGRMYQGDCLEVMRALESDTVDLVFADPPFNLDKLYPSEMNDSLKEEEYLKWCEQWLDECVRILKPGGALFTWNLPQWNTRIAYFLHSRLTFKHWIATDIKYSMPISGRLYPSHYSLIYFVKGEKANTFKPDRLPAQTCPKCFDDIKDYGGYKHKMNPEGISLTDVWLDIPPVRHAKYKKRKGSNELSIKLLDRVIELSTEEGDLVFDPFGGSGTTYLVAELKNRRWIGAELDPCDIIKQRFDEIESERTYYESIRSNTNSLFTEQIKKERVSRGLWTSESVREKHQKKINGLEK